MECFLVSLFPKEEPKDLIRKLPSQTFAGEGSLMKKEAPEFEERSPQEAAQDLTRFGTSSFIPPKRVEKIIPLKPQRFKIEFSASDGLAKKIQRAKEILRHKYPEGKLEDIFEEAVELLLEKRDPERKIERMKTKELEREEPKTSFSGEEKLPVKTRYIPQKIQREVYQRDYGECSYVSPGGRKCGERNFLEMDHIRAWALGGPSTVENVRLLCRSHNQWRAEKTFRL